MGLKLSSEEYLYATYDPLSFGFLLKEVGGSTKQVHYSDSNQFVPNRKLTPLILVPDIQVVDPEKIIPDGNVASALASSRWYVGSIGTATQIVLFENETGGSTADFALSRAHPSGIVIRKNVEQTSPVALFFQGEYYDSRRGSNVFISAAALLTTSSNAESIAAPVMVMSVPSSWVFDPLKGIANQTLNAYMFRTGEEVQAANSAFFWYKVENGVESLVDPANDLFYVSGKNANGTWNSSIVVNPDFMEKVHIRCRADYFEGTRPVVPLQGNMVETVFKRRFPYSLKAKLVVRSGNLIKSDVKTIVLECQVSTNKGKIANPDAHFFIRWWANKMTAGSQNFEIGHGANISVERSVIMGADSTVRPKIFFELSDHGSYKKLADKDGNVLTDKDGNILVGF